VDQDLLIIDASQSHSDPPHLVNLLCASDQSDVEASTRQHTQDLQETSNIRTLRPCKISAADPRLRPYRYLRMKFEICRRVHVYWWYVVIFLNFVLLVEKMDDFTYLLIYLLTYLLTYVLTPWCRVLLEKLTGLQLVKKFPAFRGTQRFITALTSVRHLSLAWASPIQSIYPHPTSWRSILIIIHPSMPRSPQWSPSLRFPQQDSIHPSLLYFLNFVVIFFKLMCTFRCTSLIETTGSSCL